MQNDQPIASRAQPAKDSVEKATKITHVHQRADGSEAKIVAQTMLGEGLHPSVDVTVFRRPGPYGDWKLCKDRPADNWRRLSVAKYISDGRSEALRTVTPGEILRAVSLLGQPMTNSDAPTAAATRRALANPDQRQAEIQKELATLGFRMEASLSSLDGDEDGGGDGHAIMVIATDERVNDDVLFANSHLLALAEEWSRIENFTIRSQRTPAAGEEQLSGHHERPPQA